MLEEKVQAALLSTNTAVLISIIGTLRYQDGTSKDGYRK